MRRRTLLSLDTPDGRRPLVLAWGVSCTEETGLLGLNLGLALARHPSFSPIYADDFVPGDLALDPLRRQALAELHAASAVLRDAEPGTDIDATVLTALGPDLTCSGPRPIRGRPPIGLAALDQATLTPAGRQRAAQYALIIAASRWTESVLRANGIIAATTVHAGIDPSIFHPAPASRRFSDRFVVFSGGPLNHHNGQDQVARAFAAFQQRHSEALLITHWHNPAEPGRNGSVDPARWAIDNGIPPHALLALGPTPEIALPHVLREANAALFPNRCTGALNPPALRAMACGIPTILSANTGHLDLLTNEGAYALRRQSPVTAPQTDTTDWGESDIEEILETLEAIHRDRCAAVSRALRASRDIADGTWARQTERLLRAIDPFLP